MSDTPTASAPTSLTDDEVAALDAHWRAANYLAVGQIYLMDNPLLTRPLVPRTSSRGCSATGAPRRGSISSTPTSTG